MKIFMPAPKKSLGQNFLYNPEICSRMAALLASDQSDNIIEVGPGPGILTRALESLPHDKLLLVEKDEYWAREQENAAMPNTEVLTQDALGIDWQGLCQKGSWKFAGNLPYNIASPLIWNIVSQCRGWTKAVFMVQKEVAMRICAKPGSKIYGSLSVWVQSHAIPRIEFNLAPGSFKPAPKVDSSVISLLPKSVTPNHPDKLKRMLDICFQNRRKQLGTILKSAGCSDLPKILDELGIDPKSRPENLTCEDFANLASGCI